MAFAEIEVMITLNMVMTSFVVFVFAFMVVLLMGFSGVGEATMAVGLIVGAFVVISYSGSAPSYAKS